VGAEGGVLPTVPRKIVWWLHVRDPQISEVGLTRRHRSQTRAAVPMATGAGHYLITAGISSSVEKETGRQDIQN
jgi:hypothetical protein